MRKVVFEAVGVTPLAALEANRAHSATLNLHSPRATAGKLAVVGGGPSARDWLDELKTFDGEVWGINGAARWCRERRIDASLFTISACKYPPQYIEGIERAVLSNECDPDLFRGLDGASVSVFDRDGDGPTSVCAVPAVAVHAGFREVSFFGCEGAYGRSTHSYQDAPTHGDMLVSSGGNVYRTAIGYFMQSQVLAEFIRAVPTVFKDRSGGLLSALVVNPEDWDVIKTPSELRDAA